MVKFDDGGPGRSMSGLMESTIILANNQATSLAGQALDVMEISKTTFPCECSSVFDCSLGRLCSCGQSSPPRLHSAGKKTPSSVCSSAGGVCQLTPEKPLFLATAASSGEYQFAVLKPDLPFAHISGVWNFSIDGRSQAKTSNITGMYISVDPAFHASPVNRGRQDRLAKEIGKAGLRKS